jgi:mevalonate kinase
MAFAADEIQTLIDLFIASEERMDVKNKKQTQEILETTRFERQAAQRKLAMKILKTTRAERKKENEKQTKEILTTTRAERQEENKHQTAEILKTARAERQEENKHQTAEIYDAIGSVVESLDDAFARKNTEKRIEEIADHLHATP